MIGKLRNLLKSSMLYCPIAIHTPTKDKWIEVQTLLNISITGEWETFGDKTCISLEKEHRLVYQHIDNFKKEEYFIIYDF